MNTNPQPFLAISNRLRSTPFYERVREQGVKAFTVYNHMLLATEFDTLESDYWHLCEHVQVWDVGAERQVDIKGADAHKLVQWMTPRDIGNVSAGRCIYVPLADENGKLINDPVALKHDDNHWWLSVADSDVLLWAKGLAAAARLNVVVHEPAVWPLAVQGPKSEDLMAKVFGEEVRDIRFFRFQPMVFNGHAFNVARSGWSKQGGYEIYVDDAKLGVELYDALFAAGKVMQVRAGCPNLIERMESSLLSFGNDMTLDHTVIESGLDSFFDLQADVESLSIDALRREQARGPDRKLVGLAIASASDSIQVATDPLSGYMLDHTGQAIGRLGTQVWSPKYQHHLVTVMLERPFFNGHKESVQEESAQIAVQLLDGSSAQARILPLPFDFKAAGIV